MSDDASFVFLKSAGIIALLTLVSRVLGFVRDAILAMALGAGVAADAFFLAFRIPDLFRKLFSDGALSLSFIPEFTQTLIHKGIEEAYMVARTVLYWLLATAALPIFLVWIWHLLYYGCEKSYLFSDASFHGHALLLFEIMMPYGVTTVCLAVSAGILNTLGHFATPAMAPICFNVVMIFSAMAAHLISVSPSVILAGAVTVGGGIQMVMTAPFLLKKGFHFFGTLSFFHPAVKKILLLGLPAMVGTAGYQINIFIATLFASSLEEGSISYLYYADRLIQFPLALFTISLATPLFPALSQKAVAGDVEGASDLFMKGVQIVFFVIIPSMMGLALMREPIVALLFHQGAFDQGDVHHTAELLLFMAMGLCPLSGIRFYAPIYYALSDMKTPLIAALIAMGAHLAISWMVVDKMGVAGLGLSVSVSSAINFLILQRGLASLGIFFCFWNVGKTVAKALFLSVVMGSVVYPLTGALCPASLFSDKGAMVLGVSLTVVAGVVVYVGLSFCIRAKEMKMILKTGKKR